MKDRQQQLQEACQNPCGEATGQTMRISRRRGNERSVRWLRSSSRLFQMLHIHLDVRHFDATVFHRGRLSNADGRGPPLAQSSSCTVWTRGKFE